MKSCRNCESPLLYDAEFCPKCGQKFTDGKNPLLGIFTEFVDAIFSFESRTLRTLVEMFFPAGLTKKYFAGKQIGYMHPLRIFLFSAALFIGAVGVKISNQLSESAETMSRTIHEFSLKEKITTDLDSVYLDYQVANRNAISEIKGDDLMSCLKESLNGEINLDSFGISFSNKKLEDVSVYEIYNGNVDSLAQKYGASGYFEKLIMTQMIRFTKDPKAFMQASIGNLIWMVLLLMPAVAFVLKLLYVRRKKFFVEHLVFSFHYHSFVFLFFAFLLSFFTYNAVYFLLSFLLALFYLFLSMKNYYGQSFLKTLFKWFVLMLGYIAIFAIFFALMIAASFFTF